MPQKTWAVGEEVLAADFNTYVQQQVVGTFATKTALDAYAGPNGALAVTTDTNTVYQRVAGAWTASVGATAWTAPTFVNGWVNTGAGYQPMQYRKIDDIVYVRGVVRSGTMPSTIFALPVGFRPPAHLQVAVDSFNGSANIHGMVTIASDGNFNASAGSNAGFNVNVAFSTI